MAKTLRILRQNVVDDGTLSASSEVSSLPVENLVADDPNALWRATSSSAQVTADLGSQVELGVTALVNSNMGSGDQARVRLSTGDASGASGDAYDSGLISAGVDPAFGYFVHFFGPATGRYLRIDLDQSSNAEAGRWIAGPVWAPSRDMAFGWEPLWRDESRITRSMGLSMFVDRRPRQRGFGFTLRGITTTEAEDEVHEINRLAGTSRDILVCRDKDASNLGKVTIWGLLEMPALYPQPHLNFFEVEMRLWERL